MSKFHFDEDIPEVIRPDLERWFGTYEWAIPQWCHTVYIGWVGGDYANGPAAVMTNDVNYRYRWARITVHGRWTDQPDSHRNRLVLHEIVHVAVDALYHWTRQQIKELTKDDDRLRRILDEEAEERIEAIVEDLTTIVLSRPQEENKTLASSQAVMLMNDLGVKPNGGTEA